MDIPDEIINRNKRGEGIKKRKEKRRRESL